MGQFSRPEPVVHQLFEEDARAKLPGELEGKFALLLVGDMHIHPFDNSNCIVWLSRFIEEIKPETVVFLGDVAEMQHLRGFKRNFNPDFLIKTDAQIIADIMLEQGHASLQNLVDAEITKVREKISRLKSVIGRNRINAVMTGGNHDHRLVEAGQYFNQPFWDINALCYEKAGINYVPFQQIYSLGGLKFSHIYPGESSGGIFVHGHDHELIITADRVCPGVFTEWQPLHWSERPPWRGLVLIDTDGAYHTITMDTLEKRYGNPRPIIEAVNNFYPAQR
jgi:hypothetical protein